MSYTHMQTAELVNIVRNKLREFDGEQPSSPWSEKTDEQKLASAETIRHYAEDGGYGLMSAEEIHNEWIKKKQAEGWIYGPEFNFEAKTDPSMTVHWDLPYNEAIRDDLYTIFITIMDPK